MLDNPMIYDHREIFVSPRQGGKTTQALVWLSESEDRVLLVPDNSQREWVLRHAQKLGIYIGPRDRWHKRVLTPADITNQRLRGIERAEVGVDNLDLFVRRITGGHHLSFATITGSVWRPRELDLPMSSRAHQIVNTVLVENVRRYDAPESRAAAAELLRRDVRP